MCDHHQLNFSMENNFYEHYLQQHAVMTKYFQGLHQNLSPCTCYNNYESHHYNTCNHQAVYSGPQDSSNWKCSSSGSSSESYSSETSSSSNYELEQQVDHESCQDDSQSEYEYVLNVDAIIAMRAAKEEIINKTSTSESDSIVLIDSDKEEFEFVNFEGMASLSSSLAQGIGNTNRNQEMKTQKKIMEYLYGEKSSTIAGLETAMALSFERLHDIHQPSLWPVLPVRL